MFASKHSHHDILSRGHLHHCIPIKGHSYSLHTYKGTFASWLAPRGHLHHDIPTRGHLHHCIPTRVHSHHGMHHKDIRITAYPQGYISVMAYSQEDIRIMTHPQGASASLHAYKRTFASWYIYKKHLHRKTFASPSLQIDICIMVKYVRWHHHE